MTRAGEVAELLRGEGVVGASVALGDGAVVDVVDVAAVGETRFGTGQPMTPETVLQIGSLTKLYTATLVAQLVEDGAVGLDEPFRAYVPEFQPKDRELADAVTVRALLSHTSGLQADFVVDTGRGDDCLARFVEECATIEQGVPGLRYEYCNAGYVLLGRLVEKLTGGTWDVALAERLLRPAGLTHTVTLPEEVLLHANATGHFPAPDGGWDVVPTWSVPRVGGPAGTVCATAADVVRFVSARDRLLRPETVALLQRAQVAVEGAEHDERCGLGWHLRTAGGRELVGHTGGNMGQGGMVWLDVARERTVCVLVNGLADMALLEDVLLEALA